jgi:hypothetical protein
VGNVLPVGVPPQLGIDAGDDQAGNGDAGTELASLLLYHVYDGAAIDPMRVRDAERVYSNVS